MGIETRRIQPHTLIQGKIYFLKEPNGWDAIHKIVSVKFVGYDACPAIVIVQASDGGKQRCLRSLLLSANGMRGLVKDAGQMAGSGG